MGNFISNLLAQISTESAGVIDTGSGLIDAGAGIPATIIQGFANAVAGLGS